MKPMERLNEHRTSLRRITPLKHGLRREIHLDGKVIVLTNRCVRGRLVEEMDLPPGGRVETPGIPNRNSVGRVRSDEK